MRERAFGGGVVVAVLGGLVVSFAFSARASAQEAPAAVEPVAPIASYGFRERDLVARAVDGTVLRAIPLASRGAAVSPTPLVVGDTLVACTDAWVYTLDPVSLVVRSRALLPGRCRTLQSSGLRVHLFVGTSLDPSSPVLRISFDPTELRVPFALSDIGGLVAQRARAAVIDLPEGLTPGGRIAAMREPLRRAAVETALTEVERRAALDPTNPWFDVERGHLLGALGRTDEAHRAYEAALAHDASYDADLLGVSTELDLVEPALADVAFTRGLRAWVQRGYEPELALGLITTVAILRTPERDLRGDTRFEYLVRRAERLARFAPVVEGSAHFYEALRLEAHARGDAREARLAALRDRAIGTRMLGPLSVEARAAGDLLNAIAAIAAAILVVLGIQVARARSRRPAEGTTSVRRFLPFVRLSWVARLSAVVGVVALLAVGTFAAHGIAEIGMVSQSPVGFMSGYMGDAQSIAFTRSFGDTDEGMLVRGYALQLAGDGRAAMRAYEHSNHPRAHLNRGVLLASRGDEAGARRAFQDALDADPGLAEAAFDLGHPARSSRLDRLRRAGVLAPFWAAPTRQDVSLAIRGAVAKNQRRVLSSPIRATASLFMLTGSISTSEPTPSLPVLVLYAVLALAALAVLAPSVGLEWESTGKGRVGYVLGLLVPGGSRAYGPFGVLVLALFFTMLLGTFTLASTHGEAANVLDSLAMPDLSRFFGASAPIATGAGASVRSFYGAWWIVALAHALFVLVTERLFPDPLREKP